MATVPESQLRLVYSLLKPVVRAAARFHIPLRTVSELLRLAYFESLRRDGMSQAEIGRRLGQSERHMRSFEQRLKSDFFAAERDIGLAREIEDYVATHGPRESDLRKRFASYAAAEVVEAIEMLSAEQRIVREEGARFRTGRCYVLLTSDRFQQRIDALNHFLDGTYQAIVQRLVFDVRYDAMIKTISFSALPERVHEWRQKLEADLRNAIDALETEAAQNPDRLRRYVFGSALSPAIETRATTSAKDREES